MRNFILTCLLVLNFSTGCWRDLRLPDSDLLSTARLIEHTEKQNATRQRVSGRYQAKATGIKQFFGHVDLIMAAQTPSSFYVSIPSLFEMPARIVTSDGEHIFLLDLSGADPLYLLNPSNSQTLNQWLGLPIEPKEFVNALLGVVDLKNTQILESSINRRKRFYELTLTGANNTLLVLAFDGDNDDLLSQTSYENNNLIYKVEYSDFRVHGASRFPWSIKLLVKTKAESIKLNLEAQDLSFPDEPFEISTFQIEEP